MTTSTGPSVVTGEFGVVEDWVDPLVEGWLVADVGGDVDVIGSLVKLVGGSVVGLVEGWVIGVVGDWVVGDWVVGVVTSWDVVDWRVVGRVVTVVGLGVVLLLVCKSSCKSCWKSCNNLCAPANNR